MLPKQVRYYLLAALEATPELLEAALDGLTDEAADRRPDPQRFTLREMTAHLADWESIFAERMGRTRDEDEPTLPGLDEEQMAVERDYAHADWRAKLAEFGEGRARMLALLHGLPLDAWDRVAHRTEIGPLTLEGQAVLVSAHDVYHLRQATAWRRIFAGNEKD
jgi:uncharacterized damage-inducible protein DinB